MNNVGDGWQHATSRDLVTWTNHGNQVGTYSGFILPGGDGEVYAGQRCGNAWCRADGSKAGPSCGDPRQTSCPGVVVNGTGPISGLVHDVAQVCAHVCMVRCGRVIACTHQLMFNKACEPPSVCISTLANMSNDTSPRAMTQEP